MFDLQRVARDRLSPTFAWRLADALHIGDEVPNNFVGQHGAPGRHAVGPAMIDAEIDVHRLAAVDEETVAQCGSHSAAAVRRVTADAIESVEIGHAALQGLRVPFDGIDDRGRRRRIAGQERRHRRAQIFLAGLIEADRGRRISLWSIVRRMSLAIAALALVPAERLALAQAPAASGAVLCARRHDACARMWTSTDTQLNVRISATAA